MTAASAPRDRAVLALSLLIVAVSLGWGLGLPRMAGLALYEEQPMAAVLGLSMALTAMAWAGRRPWRAVLWAFGAGMLALSLLLAWRYPQLMILSALRPPWLVASCAALLAGLALLVRKAVGLPVVLIVAGFSALALSGGWLGIPATPPGRFAVYMATDPNAMIGLPLRVAVQIVIPYLLFGALLQATGGGAFFTDLAIAAFGRFRGGQAKAAIGASALFGTVSGNAVSNVAGTGVVTIPLMVRSGLQPHVAGAVEAAASTGGQLLPPVMGAAAFVMADTLQVPYLHVAAAALLPALLYYAAIFVQVDRHAARRGLARASGAGPRARATLAAGWHFLIPFAVLFWMLFRHQTRPDLAALGALAALAVAAAIRPWQGRRLGPRMLLAAIEETGRSAAPLVLVTAAAGLVIGLVSLTGLGFSIAMQAVTASGGSTLLLLVLVAGIAILFGMGMPTVAVYVVLATVLAPALTEAGLQPMQAHLFILYFGLMSMLTPPVALASITAARIAGTDMWRTSLAAMRLAWVAYVIPFLFAFAPELLLIGPARATALAAATALAGTVALSIAAVGHARGPTGPLARLGFAAAGVALLLPPAWGPLVAVGNLAGAVALAALYAGSARRPRPAGS